MPAPSFCCLQVGALTFGKLKAIESEAAATVPALAEGQGSGKTPQDSPGIDTPVAETEQQQAVPEVAPLFASSHIMILIFTYTEPSKIYP